MARGKSVTKLLLDSSQAALFAGIEIHNKPNITYRYPTATILIINAWELLLKAYVYKYIGKRRIYEADGKHTITFSKVLVLVRDDVNAKQRNQKFMAVSENLDKLNDYRCSNIHFCDNRLDPIIFMLIGKAVLNYDVFIRRYFNKDITKNDNLIILPIGMKLPFDPIDYLKQDFGKTHNDFVNDVIQSIRSLDDSGVQDSIVIGFNLVTDRVRDVKNADLIAALSNSAEAVALRRTVRITDDPNAPAFRPDDNLPPLTYQMVRDKVKELRPSLKFSNWFNEIMRQVKANSELCQVRYLDPKAKKGIKKEYYYEKAVQFIVDRYDSEVVL